MADKIVSLTMEGKAKLEAELAELKSTKREEIAEKIKIARSYGDLSENSEYDEAKNEQAIVESRIATLEATLKNAVIVEDEAEVKIDEDRIRLGNTIRVLDLETGEEQVYDIVSSIEADPMNGKISDDSPLGSAVLGQQSGQTIEVEAPIGTLKYKILGIEK
ncbi:MAG: transcription elongation factor GreA [Clostridiales bacterium]|nr:MAG: transcription elongation factor GreA [Clostridiales bacterium]